MADEEKEAPASGETVPEAAAGDTPPATESKFQAVMKMRFWRHVFMAVISAVIVAVILVVSYFWGNEIFRTATSRKIHLIPYLTNLAGILLFILSTSRKKREGWKLRDYWGDYCFRVAESFAYLFIVLWAWKRATEGDAAAGAAVAGPVAAGIGPHIVGFLVGLFILRVERAMEALGDKFEEMLMAILPRSVQYITAEERRRQQLKMVYKVDEVATQYDALRSQIDDPAARTRIDKLVSDARAAAQGEDPDKLSTSVDELTRTFEDVKKSTGEVLVSVDEFLGKVVREENKPK